MKHLNLSEAQLAQGSQTTSGPNDILLPNENDVNHLSIDIGGSLTKVVYFSRKSSAASALNNYVNGAAAAAAEYGGANLSSTSASSLSSTTEILTGDVRSGGGGYLHFVKFPTDSIDQCIQFIKDLLAKNNGRPNIIKATGGGAHKYYDLFLKELNIKLEKHDEMQCVVRGLNFLRSCIYNEVFSFNESAEREYHSPAIHQEFPFLIVNIGSGVSILKVKGEDKVERVSGTSLGGGTLWGLLSLLTNCKDFDEMLLLASQGDNRNVDMLVGDIYGTDYSSIGLKATTIASSFGKVFQKNIEKKDVRPEDIAQSALYMISNNIGQIAYLNAVHHNVSVIYFTGTFIGSHLDTMRTISYAIRFWSKGTMRACFVRHHAFVGALGSFLQYEDKKELITTGSNQMISVVDENSDNEIGTVHSQNK